jgi:hypothetical protein
MTKRFDVSRASESHTNWMIFVQEGSDLFPPEFRAFDHDEYFRTPPCPVASCHIDNDLQMLVAVDWLLERDWELDLSRCDAAFLSVYPVTAEAA